MAGETANIAKMAEILSKEVFSRFLWQSAGPWNQHWPCEKQEHDRKEHPSDVVFFYDEPYSVKRTYVNCDLKSYARDSISTGAVHTAVQNLADTLACAEISSDWRKRFIHDEKTAEIIGLLFIYNHDGAYDKDFDRILRELKREEIKIPRGSRIVILGPKDIQWLDNVRYEITHLRGLGKLPAEVACRFYYPELVRKKNVQPKLARAATLEMLTGPWIVLSYDKSGANKRGYVLFYKRRGETAEEFLYLLDYITHYQMLSEDAEISVRSLDPDPNAAANFARAKTEYIETFEGGEEIAALLSAVTYERIHTIHTFFSEEHIGMI